MKQIALAFHGYHDAMKTMPYGQFAGYANNSAMPTPRAPSSHACFAWPVSLMPYIDQTPLYNTIVNWCVTNPGSATYSAPVTINGNTVAAYICPADPRDGGTFATEGFQTNYLGCNGASVFWDGGTYPQTGSGNTGVVLANTSITLNNITDGTSNTLLVSETLRWAGPGSDDRRGRMFNTYQGETFFSTLYLPNTATADSQYSCGANLPSYLPCTAVGGGANPINSARSLHNGKGGVNAAFADGTVKWIANNVALTNWQAMGTRTAGDIADVSGL